MSMHQDEALLTAFHLMDQDEREFYLEVFQDQVKGRPKREKPNLSIVTPNLITHSSRPLRSGLG
jgi:hypothetical protein